ncbi:MAG TPA: hypothetical protein VFQ68_01625 [Streptosporangiaceae bacterium]|nr:hypothetical protein [Streptosporangiaceae bacterium]
MARHTGPGLGALACALIPLTAACVSAASSPAATATGTVQAVSGPKPTFSYPGNPHCAITYRDDGDGSMSWTATATATVAVAGAGAGAGELITHASDKSGDINRRDVHVSVGPNMFTAQVPLSQVDDIGGVLYGSSGLSWACSVAPQR